MSYLTPLQLLDLIGAQELAQVATPDHLAVVDAALMEATLRSEDRSEWSAEENLVADRALGTIIAAITQATDEIDGYLALRYELPVAGTAQGLCRVWCRKLARAILHRHLPLAAGSDPKHPIHVDADQVRKELQRVADGKLSLGRGDPIATSSSDAVHVDGAPRHWSRKARGFQQ